MSVPIIKTNMHEEEATFDGQTIKYDVPSEYHTIIGRLSWDVNESSIFSDRIKSMFDLLILYGVNTGNEVKLCRKASVVKDELRD